MALRWFCVFVLIGCGPPRPAPQPQPEEETTSGSTSESEETVQPAEPSGPVIPRCGAAEGAPLTTFSGLSSADGALHHVVVSHRQSTWMPVEQVPMPMHHATALRWTNLEDFQTLDRARGEQLRFTFTVLSRLREHRPDENVFLNTYRARVEQLCSVSAPGDRPVGALLASSGLDTSSCDGLQAAVTTAARSFGECTRDAQCSVVDMGVPYFFDVECDIEGIGCYWVAANGENAMTDLTGALHALRDQPCPVSDCDCPTPPTAARCRGGQCVAR